MITTTEAPEKQQKLSTWTENPLRLIKMCHLAGKLGGQRGNWLKGGAMEAGGLIEGGDGYDRVWGWMLHAHCGIICCLLVLALCGYVAFKSVRRLSLCHGEHAQWPQLPKWRPTPTREMWQDSGEFGGTLAYDSSQVNKRVEFMLQFRGVNVKCNVTISSNQIRKHTHAPSYMHARILLMCAYAQEMERQQHRVTENIIQILSKFTHL